MSEDTEQSFVPTLAQQGGVMFVGRVFSFPFLVVNWECVLTAARRRRCLRQSLSGVQSASFVFDIVLPPEHGEEVRADGTVRRLVDSTYPEYLLASDPTIPEI